MRHAAELLDVVDGVVRGNAHDGAHLVAAPLVIGRMALAAHPAVALEDDVVLEPGLLEVHAGRKTCRAAADDRDAFVLVNHEFLLNLV